MYHHATHPEYHQQMSVMLCDENYAAVQNNDQMMCRRSNCFFVDSGVLQAAPTKSAGARIASSPA